MNNGLIKIFLGTLITIFNLKLGYVNVLPNFVGILIIISGINTINHKSSLPKFKQISSLGLLIVLISLVLAVTELFYQDSFFQFYNNVILKVTFIILEFVFFYQIIEALIKYLIKVDSNNNHITSSTNKLKTYTIFSLINLLFLGLGYIFNLEKYSIIFVVFAIVLKFYFLVIVFSIKDYLTLKDLHE